MKYYKNENQEVFGYDETDNSQLVLIQGAINSGWEDVTGSWPPPPSLDDLKVLQVQSISLAFEAMLLAGFVTSLKIKMDATLESLQKLKTGYDFAVLTGSSDMTIVDYDNVAHVGLPLADVVTLLKEVGSNYQALYSKKQTLRGQVMAATTPEAVAEVVWS